MPFRPVRQGKKISTFLLTTFHPLKNCCVDDLIFYTKKIPSSLNLNAILQSFSCWNFSIEALKNEISLIDKFLFRL
jgi:hypothetical protein